MIGRVVLPVAILAAGIVAYLVLSPEPEKKKRPPAKPRTIRTRVVDLRVEDFPVVIRTHGVVRAYNEVSLSAQVSGEIVRISPSFEAGSYFEKDEVLVELDDRDFKTALIIAEARHLGATSTLDVTTQAHERAKDLLSMAVGTEVEVEQAAANKLQARVDLDVAAAQVAKAKLDLERTKIRAPFDGRVRHKTVGLGQRAGAGMPLGVVFAIGFAEVRLPVTSGDLPFLDLPELADDPPIEVELRDAVDEKSETVWKGKIVRTEGTLDPDSLELFAVARIDDPFGRKSGQPPLRIGQPVVGSISGKVLEGVVAVPRHAVLRLDQIYLVDKEDLTLSIRTIEPVWSDDEFVVVRDPTIAEGKMLAITRLVYAPEGAKVEIIPEIGETAESEKSASGSKIRPTLK